MTTKPVQNLSIEAAQGVGRQERDVKAGVLTEDSGRKAAHEPSTCTQGLVEFARNPVTTGGTFQQTVGCEGIAEVRKVVLESVIHRPSRFWVNSGLEQDAGTLDVGSEEAVRSDNTVWTGCKKPPDHT